MSTTHKYNFTFAIPKALRTLPIPFSDFHKGFDEEGNDLGFLNYDEHTSQPGKAPTETPSGTHVLLDAKVTSVLDLARKFPYYISQVAPDTVVYDGVDIEHWEDGDQTNYLWIISTEPDIAYGLQNFKLQSPLFKAQVETP